MKAGTLDDEGKKRVKPDVQIYTSTKMDWVDLSGEKERGVPVLEEYYRRDKVWRKDALERMEVLERKIGEAKKAEQGPGKEKEGS